MVGAASSALGLPPQDVLRWFGREALPQMAAAHPDFFTGHTTATSFVLNLNDIIHPEVRKLYPGADVPDFDFATPADDVLVLTYRSHRSLCGFAEGLIEGAAAHYGEQVRIDQPECKLRDGDVCVLWCQFSPGRAG